MRHLLFLFLCFADPTPPTPVSELTILAPAAPVQAPGEYRVGPGKQQRIEAVAPAGKLVRWINPHPDVELSEFENGKLCIFTAIKPGRYTLWAYSATADGQPSKAKSVVVVVGTVPPGPPPVDPDPPPIDPKPVDPVTPSKLVMVVVEESAQRSQAQASLYASQALQDRFKERGHTWRIVDKDVKDDKGGVPSWLAPYLQKANGKTLPWVILLTPEGKVRAEFTLPVSADDLLNQIKKAGG